ncbi:hypothetical protein [Leptothoe sp. PORK10 BA2]|uniref:hypothetical protein n=1 Tax=Leptothoe sp. PORK10 BA2 TaxID=3110254 RepID=UPI002B20ECAB|nr:hypothetical protein [Leptothoe sp. PORK10 BA2]MEA5465852.1 hypothetical protein [Leptothoe sp. PORK10 BA2]
MTAWVNVVGKVVRGHGVASGQGGNPRFPGGTIRMQQPVFASQGLALDPYFPGTINLSIHPYRYVVKQAKHTFRQIKWAADAPPEDFSFFDCRLVLSSGQRVNGLIYYPHPETKPEHFQDPATLEVLTEFIDGLSYDMSLGLELKPNQLLIEVC